MGGIGFRPVGGASLRTLGWAPLPVRLPSPAAASFQPCPPVGAVSVAAAAVPVGASALSRVPSRQVSGVRPPWLSSLRQPGSGEPR